MKEKDFRKPKGWLLNNPEYCNNTNDICYKNVSDLVDRLAAENARTVEGGDGQPTEGELFPVEYYPPLIRDFCKNVADWMSVDVSVPGILVLTAASAAIGYSATLEQKDFDGAIRPIFHSAIVLDSGLGKSPIMKRMFAPHNKKNDEEHKQSRKKEIQITIENMGKKDKDKKKIPFVPPRIIKGTTIEGMQDVLSRIHNEAVLSELGLTVNGETTKKFKKPGILWFYEEMAEMLESMNAFKNGKGDSSVICTILDGSGASTTRVDKEKNRYYPDCHVALAGGIQGDMLQDIADKNPHFFYQGLFQRMNFVVPPFRDQKADSPSLNQFLKEKYDSTIGNLFDIGERVYSLSSEAEAVYLEYKKSCVEILNPLGRLGDSKTKAERAIMSATSKSKRTILIIALILEILKDETQEDIISGETMGGAVAIVKFLLNNFRRIANYCPKDGATKKNQVYNAIIKAGDSGLSRRDIQQRFFRGQGQGGKNLDDFLVLCVGYIGIAFCFVATAGFFMFSFSFGSVIINASTVLLVGKFFILALTLFFTYFSLFFVKTLLFVKQVEYIVSVITEITMCLVDNLIGMLHGVITVLFNKFVDFNTYRKNLKNTGIAVFIQILFQNF